MTLTMDLFLLVATFAVGMGTVAYRSRARMSGWPVGGLYTSDAGILQVLGFIAWIGAAYLGFSYLGLWSGVIVVLGGFVLGDRKSVV